MLLFVALAGCRLGFDEHPDAAVEPLTPPVFTAQPNGATSIIYDLFIASATDIYACGQEGLQRSSGDGTWADIPVAASQYYWLWGSSSSSSDVYVAGNVNGIGDASLAHVVDGVATSQVTGLMRPISDGWSSSPADTYAVGYDGNIIHSDGSGTWITQPAGTTVRLTAIWASGPDDLYVVGDGGTILHSTGDGAWTPQASGTVAKLIDVWGSGADDIYVVGYAGSILHSTGDGAWTRQPTEVPYDLYAIGGHRGKIYVVGRADMVLLSRGDGAWTEFPLHAGASQVDAIVELSPDSLYIAATPGLLLHGS
ncbi:hypothetical protein BH11MYX1_BH11MYX1_13510 [soil metagenome]